MCEDFYKIDTWNEGDFFICKICAEILSKIKERQCFKEKKGFPKGYWLFEFDYMRDQERKKGN